MDSSKSPEIVLWDLDLSGLDAEAVTDRLERLAPELAAALTDRNVSGLALRLTGGGKGPAPDALLVPLDTAAKPVVAAIDGEVSGPLLDLASVAHFRIGTEGSRISGPALSSGASQRLPRLLGAQATLSLFRGKALSAEKLAETAFLDGVVKGAAGPSAMTLAQSLANAGAEPTPTRDRRDGLDPARRFARQVAQGRAASPEPAWQRIVDSVEAALLLPFDAGLSFERVAAVDLAGSADADAPASARSPSGAPDARAPTPDPKHLSLLAGAEAPLGLIAEALVLGFSLEMHPHSDLAEPVLRQSLGHVLGQAVAAGALTAEDAEAALSRIQSSDAPPRAVLVLGPVADPSRASAALGDGLTATSPTLLFSTEPDQPRPDRADWPARALEWLEFPVLGPDQAVEIVPGPSTELHHQETSAELARELLRAPVLAGLGSGGFLAGLRETLRAAMDNLLLEGATPEEVDAALSAARWPFGVYAAADAEGLRPRAQARAKGAATRDPRDNPAPVLEALVAAGRLGREAGAGFFRYGPEGLRPGRDAVLEGILSDARQATGHHPRAVSGREILDRAYLALVLAGARALERGAARSPADVDRATRALLGLSTDARAPMAWADARGLDRVRAEIAALAEDVDARFWAVPPLLSDLADAGLGFDAFRSVLTLPR